MSCGTRNVDVVKTAMSRHSLAESVLFALYLASGDRTSDHAALSFVKSLVNRRTAYKENALDGKEAPDAKHF